MFTPRLLRINAVCVACLLLSSLALAGDNPKTDLNQRVLDYAKSKLDGTAVGNGECTTLADLALASAGARRPGQGNYGWYIYGAQVTLEQARPGDIIQLDQVKIANADGSVANIKHHTVILTEVDGKKIKYIEQNSGATAKERRTVRQGALDLSGYQYGAIRYWRPQPR